MQIPYVTHLLLTNKQLEAYLLQSDIDDGAGVKSLIFSQVKLEQLLPDYGLLHSLEFVSFKVKQFDKFAV